MSHFSVYAPLSISGGWYTSLPIGSFIGSFSFLSVDTDEVDDRLSPGDVGVIPPPLVFALMLLMLTVTASLNPISFTDLMVALLP